MNDIGEFDYARNVIYEVLNEIEKNRNLPPVAQGLTAYIRKNLAKLLINTIEMSNSYCSCLTISSDHQKQWVTYAEDGKGFAIGFDLLKFLKGQASAIKQGKPYICCAPLCYSVTRQHDLVWRFLESGIRDLQRFADTVSRQPRDLTMLRDRITESIVVQVIVLINFIKSPTFKSEREFRLIWSPNDGTTRIAKVLYYERDNEFIPYIFMDLSSSETGRLPLAEIKIGPRASFAKENTFLENLLDELGYGGNYKDRPQITKSLL